MSYWYMQNSADNVSVRVVPPEKDDYRPYAESDEVIPAGKVAHLISDPSSPSGYSVEFIIPPAPEPDERVLLKEQLKSLDERNDFLEECIVEMANIIYNQNIPVE